MKRLLAMWLCILVLVPLPVLMAQTQDPPDQIARLQTEIARRETVDRDESTPADLKAMNHAALDKKRTELLNAIQARINGLQKYLETLGTSVTPDEREYAQRLLKDLASVTQAPSTPVGVVVSSVAVNGSGSVRTLMPQPAVVTFGRPLPASLTQPDAAAAPTASPSPDDRKGSAVGYLFGGVVLSQQAAEFSQSDPFFGFSAGYDSDLHGRDKDDLDSRSIHNWRWHLRFQGVFTADGRTATGQTAPVAPSIANPST